MVASIAAGTTVQYYLSRSDYYLGGDEPQGVWVAAAGFGAELRQAVDGELFASLHAGLDRAGLPLLTNDGNRIEQVGGYDLTFSAPKSVSVLWGIGDAQLRAELEHLQLEAVGAAIEVLGENAAFCRRGKGGQQLEKVALTVAAFQHGEARPAPHSDGKTFADCALHTHAVVLNIATRSDGSVGRLDGRPLFNWGMAAGAVYHEALAKGLRRLGFRVDVTGKNGTFEIAGVAPELCRYFSARRNEIAAELAELGLETADAPALAAAKALTTRRSKPSLQQQDRHDVWRERATSFGYSPSLVVQKARALGKEQLPREPVPSALIQEDVLAQLTGTASTFERRQLVAALAARLAAEAGAISLEDQLASLDATDELVELDRDRWGHAVYSTRQIIALERGLHERASRLTMETVRSPSPERVDALVEAAQLNPEQAAAAKMACGSKALALIEGGPGVGKTTLLSPVAAAWQESGWRVIGASTAWKIANQLRDDLNIEARAIDSWLARVEHDQDFLTDKTVLLVDEAGLLTSRQMDRLISEVERAQKAGLQVAVRMVGDRRQLQPIGGPGLRIVAEAIGVKRVDTIVRQRQQWARDVVTSFGKGNALAALSAVDERGHFHQCDGERDTVSRLTTAWHAFRENQGDTAALMIAKTNRQVIALNAAARSLLRASGRIDTTVSAEFDAATPSGQSHRLELARGDLVRFLQRDDALGVINGSVATVVDLQAAGLDRTTITIRMGGRKVQFASDELADEKGRLQLAHAYATTCYGAQGLTTEQAFVLLDPAMDRHDVFVAASRAREATHLFVDRKGLDGRVKAARLLHDRVRQVETSERLEVLSSALSRVGTKASTLDYLRPSSQEQLVGRAVQEQPGEETKRQLAAADRQQRLRELGHEL